MKLQASLQNFKKIKIHVFSKNIIGRVGLLFL